MPQFKFELWDIENGVVITRPVKVGVDGDGEDIIKNSSVFREDTLVAIKEIQVALDYIKANHLKKTQKKI